MFDRLRRPLFVIAAVLWIIVIVTEIGSSLLPAKFDAVAMRTRTTAQLKDSTMSSGEKADVTNQILQQAQTSSKPPGLAIPELAVLDGLVFYSILLIGLALIIPERVQGRLQGIVTLAVSIIVIIVAVVLAIKAFAELMIMLSLFLAAPFGTLAYLCLWGFFNTGGAAAALSVLMVLKIAFVIVLAFAQQRFLQNKGLVLILVTSFVAMFIVAFLHGLVPVVLVSITDRIGAIVLLILAIIWGVFLAIGSVISIVKAIV